MAPARDKALVLEQFLPVAAVDPSQRPREHGGGEGGDQWLDPGGLEEAGLPPALDVRCLIGLGLACLDLLGKSPSS